MEPNEVTTFSGLSRQPNLLAKVLEQLYKDTGLSEESCFWDVEDAQAYQLFHKCLCDYLEELNMRNKPKFMRLLYRVDIPENQYKKVVANSDSDDFHQRLTDLVLNRTLQKVITRMHFDPLK